MALVCGCKPRWGRQYTLEIATISTSPPARALSRGAGGHRIRAGGEGSYFEEHALSDCLRCPGREPRAWTRGVRRRADEAHCWSAWAVGSSLGEDSRREKQQRSHTKTGDRVSAVTRRIDDHPVPVLAGALKNPLGLLEKDRRDVAQGRPRRDEAGQRKTQCGRARASCRLPASSSDVPSQARE